MCNSVKEELHHRPYGLFSILHKEEIERYDKTKSTQCRPVLFQYFVKWRIKGGLQFSCIILLLLLILTVKNDVVSLMENEYNFKMR